MAKRKALKDTKYTLKRAKNGKRREKHVSAAMYGIDKRRLQREADAFAARFGHTRMSMSAYINIKLLLPGD